MATSVMPWVFLSLLPREELLYLYAAAAAAIAVTAWCGVRAVEWAWWRPRRLGRALRSQGLRGTAYRPVAGDTPLMQRLNREARSRAMPLGVGVGCHDVVPRAMPLFHRVMQEHGKTSITWFGPVPRVTISKPELVREVLSNKFGHFEKLKFGRLQRMLHNGVGSHEGEKWAKHRRIINPAFHMEKLKRMLPAFATCCMELVERWDSLVAAAGDALCEVDVWPDMQNLTGDVISRAAFGSSYLEGRRIFQLQGEQLELVTLAMSKSHIPGYLLLPTKANRRMKQIASEIERVLKGIVGKREKAMRAGEAMSDDLLGLLLESNMAHSKGEGGMGITTDEDRAREEVLRVLGPDGTPDHDGLGRLRVVTMVLHEALRLYTPLTAVHRKTYKPMELGGVRYPAGVVLMLPLLCVHHDKEVWGADADEFRPERFAEGISRAADAPAFFPFGWGPRVCVGQNFALLEAKMGLAVILRRFSLQLSPSYTHAPFPVGLLQPQHGAQLMLKRIIQ